MVQTTCPDLRELQALLEETTLPGEVDELVFHLETCLGCQSALEMLAASPSTSEATARSLLEKTREEPALRDVVERLKREESLAPRDSDLSFLQPADRPGLLGMLGPYEVEQEIGRGGMGIVLEALDPALNRVVALKILSPYLASSATARRRFIREAQTAASVCHDHVVTVHGVHEANGLPFLVMQRIQGESLQTRLDRTGPLDVMEIVRLGAETASGLAAAHARGLIHRDIKPANLLLEAGHDKVKITDFGLARMADDGTLTQQGIVAGTPEFMAPEQTRGEAVDHRADLFSLGSVLYALCTGQPPFRGSTVVAILRQVSDHEPISIREVNASVPRWLEAFISRLMQKDPASRFRSATEVAGLLEKYLAHLRQPKIVAIPTVPTLDGDALEQAEKTIHPHWFAHKRWLPILGVATALSLAIGLIVFQDKSPSAKAPAVTEIYQDFRNSQPLLDSFAMDGPDIDDVTKAEPAGLRITLPATRAENYPVAVVSKFSLVGDFEITGSYELLSATQPTKGYGVGVCLWVATDHRRKFAKVARQLLPKEGSVYKTEYWNKDIPKAYKAPWVATVVKKGQLRLVREDGTLRFLVADHPGEVFRDLLQVNLGTEDLSALHFEVTDSWSPGNAVDARLIDLKIRSGKVRSTPASADAPPAIPAEKPVSKRWLVVVQVMGGTITLTLLGLGIWIAVRRGRGSGEPSAPQPSPALISLPCPGCRKVMKIPANLAGKKGKCRDCGQAILVPRAPAGEGELT